MGVLLDLCQRQWVRISQEEKVGGDTQSITKEHTHTHCWVQAAFQLRPTNRSIAIAHACSLIADRWYALDPDKPDRSVTWL